MDILVLVPNKRQGSDGPLVDLLCRDTSTLRCSRALWSKTWMEVDDLIRTTPLLRVLKWPAAGALEPATITGSLTSPAFPHHLHSNN